MNDSIPISFKIDTAGSPLIITSFTAMIYHLAGTIWENHRRISGIFSIGNIMPLNNMIGSIKAIPLINIAACWVSATVEISRPRQRDTIAYRMDTETNNSRLPFIGTSSRK